MTSGTTAITSSSEAPTIFSSERIETPLSQLSRRKHEYTVFVSNVPEARAVSLVQTGSGDGELAVPASNSSPAKTADDTVTATRDARLELLARKFEGDASIEDRARIHLLTVRLRRLDPRVTATERAATEEIVQSLEGVSHRLAALRMQFGL